MEELEFIKKVVKNAYEKCVLGKVKEVENKDSGYFLVDLVTSCDKTVEKYITKSILKKYPNDSIIGEEYSSENVIKGRGWVIDPIDGTINFANNYPMWCMQVAFVEDMVPKASVIYIPLLNEMYYADDKCAYLNGNKIEVNSSLPTSKAILCTGDFNQHDHDIFDFQVNYIQSMYDKILKFRMVGSAGCAFSQVACGRFGGYMVITNNVWDILPGEHLCRMAGARFTISKVKDKKITIVSASDDIDNTIKTILK